MPAVKAQALNCSSEFSGIWRESGSSKDRIPRGVTSVLAFSAV